MWCLGAEPLQFSLTEDAPLNREPVLKSSKTTTDVEAEEFNIETASSGGDTQAVPESTREPVENTSPVDPEVDTIQSLLEKIALFEQQVSSYEEEITRLEKENAVLLEHQFSLDKLKDDKAAILFYTGFPTYKAVMSFFSLC